MIQRMEISLPYHGYRLFLVFSRHRCFAASCLQNTSGGGDQPRIPRDPHQDEQRAGSAGVRPRGYYDKFAESMASRKPALARSDSEDTRTVVRSDQMRADDYVDDVVQTLNLPDMTSTYDVVTPLSEGNQGDVYFLLNKAKPHALKIYKTGVNRQYTEFQKDLLRNIDNPEAKAHPGYEAVYFAALPVAWATHTGKKGLVFRYVVQPRKSRKPTASDRAQVRDQIDFLHWLGYVHLDITDRNIMLADKGKCYLMDYDCVCKIDEVPLGPVPIESTEAILTQRFPAELDDDEHLWQLLQTTFFNELSLDESKVAQPAVQHSQAAGQSSMAIYVELMLHAALNIDSICAGALPTAAPVHSPAVPVIPAVSAAAVPVLPVRPKAVPAPSTVQCPHCKAMVAARKFCFECSKELKGTMFCGTFDLGLVGSFLARFAGFMSRQYARDVSSFLCVLCILSYSADGRFDSQPGRAAGCSRSVIYNDVSGVRFWYQAAICNLGQCILQSFAIVPRVCSVRTCHQLSF